MNFPDAYTCFAIDSEEAFNKHALAVFHFQANEITIYRDFLNALRVDKSTIVNWKDIPCLPISFFKSHQLIAKDKSAEIMNRVEEHFFNKMM